MEKQDDWLNYDEFDAVKYIMDQLPEEVREKVNDENIGDIIDMMHDFYEEKGFLDDETVDENEDIEIDINEMVEYISERSENESFSHLSVEDIELIVQGELNYCDSLELPE